MWDYLIIFRLVTFFYYIYLKYNEKFGLDNNKQ